MSNDVTLLQRLQNSNFPLIELIQSTGLLGDTLSIEEDEVEDRLVYYLVTGEGDDAERVATVYSRWELPEVWDAEVLAEVFAATLDMVPVTIDSLLRKIAELSLEINGLNGEISTRQIAVEHELVNIEMAAKSLQDDDVPVGDESDIMQSIRNLREVFDIDDTHEALFEEDVLDAFDEDLQLSSAGNIDIDEILNDELSDFIEDI